MEYTYQTRQKLAETYKNTWSKKLLLVMGETKRQAVEMEEFGFYGKAPYELLNTAGQRYLAWNEGPLSAFFRNYYDKLVNLFVGKEYREDFYYILDRLNLYPYSQGPCRRTVRTAGYYSWIRYAFRLMYEYRLFRFYGCSVSDYMTDRLTQEKLDYKRNTSYGFRFTRLDDCIAARIDCGDKDTIETARALLLGDNNTAVVTVDLIRGIVKSSDESLHRLLADFLLAARLQEGIRQAVCENADCGTAQAFRVLFDTVLENNLLRFSSVKRAVAVWTGICDSEQADRITDKMLPMMKKALENCDYARELTVTNDSISICTGLWALGFYEVKAAIQIIEGYLEAGTCNQVLTASYFSRSLDAGAGYFAGEQESFAGKLAKKAVCSYHSDREIMAAYMPFYLINALQAVSGGALRTDQNEVNHNGCGELSVLQFFASEKEAVTHYDILKTVLDGMKHKKEEFSPCVFPWYGVSLSKSQLISRLCVIAFMLKDPVKRNEMADRLSQLDTSGEYAGRGTWVELLLHDPQSCEQKTQLLAFVADREQSARDTAFGIAQTLELNECHYIQLEGYLKYKTGDIRQKVLKLLKRQTPDKLGLSITRLLAAPMQELRCAGLSLILEAEKEGMSREFLSCLRRKAEDLKELSPQEELLLSEITGESKAGRILKEKGYGLYDPDEPVITPKRSGDKARIEAFFAVRVQELDRILRKLNACVESHAREVYKDSQGNEILLGERFAPLCYGRNKPMADLYPFKELWVDFYNSEIRDPHLLNLLLLYWSNTIGSRVQVKDGAKLKRYRSLLLGAAAEQFDPVELAYTKDGTSSTCYLILQILRSIYPDESMYGAALELAWFMALQIPGDDLWYEREKPANRYYYVESSLYPLTDITAAAELLRCLNQWNTQEEFALRFWPLYLLDQTFDYNGHRPQALYYHNARETDTFLSVYDYVQAYMQGLIGENAVYQAVFSQVGLSCSLEDLSRLVSEKLNRYDLNRLEPYLEDGTKLELGNSLEEQRPDSRFADTGRSFYFQITDRILDVELRRGDLPTVFSDKIRSIKRIYGMERLVEILKAIGNSKLDRSGYYSWSPGGTGRKEILSYLLQICSPLREDTAKQMAERLKGTGIHEKKLIETAMYAPQWLDIIEEYLAWPGLKSGCYYFMAHMNEHFDDRKKAMIARYTPLTPEELNEGAFDVSWFREAYSLLGEERFNLLYDSAKYISDGNRHSRARKYADASLMRVTAGELEMQIQDKRNKDLLMSYGLVPVTGKEELMHRYEFLQTFLKSSRQYGAQRRASEAAAVNVALKNMATAAGYSDVTRLTLSMEQELVKSYGSLFDGIILDEYTLRLKADASGKPEIAVSRDGKRLKTIPAGLKKAEEYLHIREICTKLKDLHSRTVKMLEHAMEERECYSYGEIWALCENPVTGPVAEALVFLTVSEDAAACVHGFMTQGGLRDCFGKMHLLGGEEKIRVAHPYDMYVAGCFRAYQKHIIDTGTGKNTAKQPFRQVFREVYVMLEEERDQYRSMQFAGNQIQPAKTAACLKGRRWVADYEEGLQKIYYRENIVARIYAMADWFSPADIEAPVLEWVEFSDRMTYKGIPLKDVPPIVYSEIMRDVDLAVSVAHAGGVDPETSHSTVEMRRAILEFSLPLFGIGNVTLEGSHAFVQGSHGAYSIHLGSGVIHQTGGHQIHVLPVHSQARGRIFLPFVDEDPKTGEIISKVVLFAEDRKIKDPYILDQIVR